MYYHCWLTLPNGDIIDPHFKEYDELVRNRGLEPVKVYVPASKMIQELILTRLTTWMIQECEEYKYFDLIPIRYKHCAMNAFVLMKTKYPEATYTVGSMGFRYGNGVMWQFGNPTWDKYHQFITCDGTEPPATRYGEDRNTSWIKGGVVAADQRLQAREREAVAV